MNDHLYLAHHGIKGMKWGVRRYQNPDGSLTSAGRLRYDVDGTRLTRAASKHMRKAAKYQRRYNTGSGITKTLNYQDKKHGKYSEENARRRNEKNNRWLERRDVETRRAKRTQEYHNNAVKYWNNLSTGKKVGTVLLYGPWGAQSYVAAKGHGYGTMAAAGETVLAQLVGGPIGNTIVNNIERYDYADRDDD